MKTCKKCSIAKPREDFYFYKSKNYTDGLCKVCRNEFNKNWRREALPEVDLYKREKLITEGKNICHVCEKIKPLKAFRKTRHVKTGYHNTCKGCKSISNKNAHLKNLYGITLSEYNRLNEEQGNACKICKTTFTDSRDVCVDHNHATAEVRGLLCQPCNRGIGLLKENIQVLYSAIRYLKNAGPVNK